MGRTWSGVPPDWSVKVPGDRAAPETAEVKDLAAADDRALVEACLAGRREAFDAIVHRHQRQVYQVCFRFVSNHEDASDLAQDVFVRAFRALETFDPVRGTLRQWLGAIARNVARRHWQKRRQGEHFDTDLAEETFAAPANPGESPESREERQALAGCVEALPAELAQVIRLRYVEARTTRGIAAATTLPESTVRLRLKEAAEALEKCLRGKGFYGQP